MVEVVYSNFAQHLPDILRDIENADFIGEYLCKARFWVKISSIVTSQSKKISLFAELKT